MRLVKPVLAGLAVLLATWNYFSEAEVRWNPGELAPDEPAQTMIDAAANWHMVPASASLARQLEKVRKGDIIVLQGTLIDLESPDHQRIRTSLTRGDTGAGACEVVWVEKIEIVYR